MAVFREFKAAPGSHLTDEKAAVYGPYLESEVGLGSRPVPAEEIMVAARPKRSPIHGEFEWDDTKAGREYRLEQARKLARGILIVTKPKGSEPVTTRAFHHVQVSNGESHEGYVSQVIVWQRPDFAEHVIEKAHRELRQWAERYKQYSQLAGLVSQVGELLERVA